MNIHMTGAQRTAMLAEVRATQADMHTYDPDDTNTQRDLDVLAEALISGDVSDAQMNILAVVCAAGADMGDDTAQRAYRVMVAGG